MTHRLQSQTRPVPARAVPLRRWSRGLLSAVTVATVGVAAVIAPPVRAAEEPAAAPTTEMRIPRVTTAIARPSEVVAEVPVSGSLLPRTEVLIYPQVSGFIIEELVADVGDAVQAGDLLVRINASTLEAQFAQAQAEAARAEASVRQAESQIASAKASQQQAEAALARAQKLAKTGNVSGASLENAVAGAATARAATASANDGLAVAQAAVQQARAASRIAQLNLDHATIKAPVDGLISQRNGQVGAITAVGGEPLYSLIRNGEIEIEAEVIETALGQIDVGDPAMLNVAGLGPVEGRVRLISPTVDPGSRLGTIRITTPARPGLRAGTFAGGVVVTDRHMALTVPASAVQIDAGQSYVLLVREGVLSRQPVMAGLIWQDRREVIRGLSEGDMVVARAGSFFAEGDRVEPIPTDPAPDPVTEPVTDAETDAETDGGEAQPDASTDTVGDARDTGQTVPTTPGTDGEPAPADETSDATQAAPTVATPATPSVTPSVATTDVRPIARPDATQTPGSQTEGSAQ